MSLLTKKETLGSMPGYAVGYFSGGELFHGMYRVSDSVFVSFIHIFLWCLRKRPLFSDDPRPREELQLRLCSCMWVFVLYESHLLIRYFQIIFLSRHFELQIGLIDWLRGNIVQ